MFDVTVIGAGVVGLAIARRFAVSGKSVLVLERHGHPGEETSSRNSEVIHAGLYYRPDSLKARLCVAGYRQLLEYCAARSVPYRIPGKLILASDEAGEARLAGIQTSARANGVDLVGPLTLDQVHKMEPSVHCRSALFSPLTGILDSHAYMMALQADIERHGGQIVCNHRVESIERQHDNWLLRICDSEGQVSDIAVPLVVNAAGLGAADLARGIQPSLAASLPEPVFAKGSYFTYSGRLPVSHLLYPTPADGGLGIHLTMDLDGQLRFGPDIEYLPDNRPNYRVTDASRPAFVRAIQTYLPELDPLKLSPGYAGIRPKVRVDGRIADDFIIQTDPNLGLANLFGIESPGLTASLAIADEVYEAL